MGGSILPVGMVWNYIGGIGIELDRCSQNTQKISEQLLEMFTLLSGFLSRRVHGD